MYVEENQLYDMLSGQSLYVSYSIVRTNYFRKDANLWSALCHTWDVAVKEVCEDGVARKLTVLGLLEKFRPLLELWTQRHELVHLEQHLKNDTCPDVSVLAHVNSTSQCAHFIFQGLSGKHEYGFFIGRFNKAITTLGDNDWLEGDVENFKAVAKAQTKAAHDNGLGHWDKKATNIEFGGVVCEDTVRNLTQEWQKRLVTKALAQALRSQQVRWMPWEIRFWPDGIIPGTIANVQVPDSLIKEAKNGRDEAFNALGERALQMDLEEIEQKLAPHHDSLEYLDKGWSVMRSFLSTRVRPVVEGRVSEAVMDSLPSQASEKSFGEVPIVQLIPTTPPCKKYMFQNLVMRKRSW